MTTVLAVLLCATTMSAQTNYTSLITNPSFENGDHTGWTATNLGPMDNDFFTAMKGTWYVKAWRMADPVSANTKL